MALFIIGLVSGIIAAMGIGGGTILIPALIFIVGVEQHTAQGINLISFIPVAIIAVLIHIKNGNVLIKLSFFLMIFGILGALIGSKIAIHLSSNVLRKIFGIFLLVISIYEFKYHKNT
ncbi:MAG: sulfite exporter TauE/SafE family protein [Clostridia bacterium]|nr:sulfite exporter TauE/SafE family protein [Clostridia bacterium]